MTLAPGQVGGGIDGAQLRALLKCYWRLGTRGKLSASMARGQGGRNRGLGWIAGTYTIVGLITCPMAFSHADVFSFSLIVDSMTLFFVAMTAAAESGDILFSTAEADVLMHRPVEPKTLLLAKSLNLLALMMLLAGALNFFPTIFALATAGSRWWYPLVHLVSLTMLCACCASAVVCAYGLVARLVDREKFDSFAAWTQVVMSVVFVAGYQFMPRLMPKLAHLQAQRFASALLPAPPAWFAGIDALGGDGVHQPMFWMLGAVGVGVTGVLCFFAIGKLSPSYGMEITRLGELRQQGKAEKKRSTWRRDWLSKIEGLIGDPMERASFRLAAAYMWRDRSTKVRLYPSLSIYVLLPLLYLRNPQSDQSSFVQFMCAWLLCAMPLMALETLRISANPLAAEIFRSAPMISGGAIFLGVRKAILVLIVFPVVVAVVVMMLLLAPDATTSMQIVFTGMIALPTISLLPGIVGSYVPLAKPLTIGSQASRNGLVMILSITSVVVIATIANLAWELGYYWWMLAAEVVVLLVVHILALVYIRRKPLVFYED